MDARTPLTELFRGWDGYQISLVQAIAPLTSGQLEFRAAPHLRTVAEIVRHIADGRLAWFQRLYGPEDSLVRQVVGELPEEEDANTLAGWLESTWWLIERSLSDWSVADLQKSFIQPYQDQNFNVPYQWLLWRLLSHDMHHGGELSLSLGMQGIEIPELGDQGGHIASLRAQSSGPPPA